MDHEILMPEQVALDAVVAPYLCRSHEALRAENERLRGDIAFAQSDLCRALTEVERLLIENERLRLVEEEAWGAARQSGRMVELMETEVERLRAALQELAAAVDPNGYHRRSPCICPECLRLRAALAAAEGQPAPPTEGG